MTTVLWIYTAFMLFMLGSVMVGYLNKEYWLGTVFGITVALFIIGAFCALPFN